MPEPIAPYARQKQAEADFGLPFPDIVKMLADNGLTMTQTGRALGYRSVTQFRRMCNTNDWRKWFKGSPKPNKPIVVTFEGFTGSLRAHFRRAGISRGKAMWRYKQSGGNIHYAIYGFYEGETFKPDDSLSDYAAYWCPPLRPMSALSTQSVGNQETNARTHPSAA